MNNIQLFGYWSSTETQSPVLPNHANAFFFGLGLLSIADPQHFVHSAWAVRDGDVGPQQEPGQAPEPASLLLFGLGALGLGWASRRKS